MNGEIERSGISARRLGEALPAAHMPARLRPERKVDQDADAQGIWKRLATAKEIDGDNFTRKGGSAIGIDIAPRRFLALCLAENERRLSRYDPRLLRPRLMPAAARLAMRLLRSDGAAR